MRAQQTDRRILTAAAPGLESCVFAAFLGTTEVVEEKVGTEGESTWKHPSGAKEAAEKQGTWGEFESELPAGAKARRQFALLAARLKPCPCYKALDAGRNAKAGSGGRSGPF